MSDLRAKAAGAEDRAVQDVKRTQCWRKEVKVCEIKDGKEQVDASILGREKQSRQKQNYIRKSA